MPSLRTLLPYALLTLLATAAPLPTTTCTAHAPPTLPTTGTGTQLPPPSADVTLKHVTLGRGVQNYTCASPSATPLSTGALATLFDLTPLAFLQPHSPLLAALPGTALAVPLALAPSIASFRFPGTVSPVAIGSHYFDAAGVPTFDLYATGERLASKKVGTAQAPAAATAQGGAGAVAWLKLDDAGGSVGLKEVYRVVTAGGDPPASCEGVVTGDGGEFSVQYAAEYWFYG